MPDQRKIIIKRLKTTTSSTGNLVSEDFSYQEIQDSINPFGFETEDVKIEVVGTEIHLIIMCIKRTNASEAVDFII